MSRRRRRWMIFGVPAFSSRYPSRLPLQEGFVWLRVRPDLALVAWREALRRAGAERKDIFRTRLCYRKAARSCGAARFKAACVQ